MENKKIFIGLNNLAVMLTDMKEAFKKLGIETITATHGNPHPANFGHVDYDFSKYKKYLFNGVRPTKFQLYLRYLFNKDSQIFRRALKECDVFIFIWSSFRWDYSDFELIKRKGKKIIMIFCGDDARWYYSQKQEFESYGMYPMEYDESYDYSTKGLHKRLLRLRTAEKYADFIFSRLDQAQLQLRPYYRWNMMVITEMIKHQPHQREIYPVIAHAPTSRVAKGTKFVLDAFEKLKNEGVQFIPLLVENKKPAEAKEMYLNSDIIIDQLICPGAGKFATEAMAMGKVVMGHMAYQNYPQKTPAECPIIDINPDTIYLKLKETILNYEKRKELAARGRNYVIKYLDTGIFCQKVIDLVSGEKIEYDYYPGFFRNHFIPESAQAAETYNKWTRFVKGERWYKDQISQGERDGLFF